MEKERENEREINRNLKFCFIFQDVSWILAVFMMKSILFEMPSHWNISLKKVLRFILMIYLQLS